MPREPDVDLRSDTMTRATPAMREAMAEAEVGNDALGEDPSVARFQEKAVDMLGTEAALMFPSGTMANLAATLAWTRDVERPEVVAEATAHLLLYESAGLSRVAGAMARPIEGEAGRMPVEAVESELRPAGGPSIKPQTAMVALEQTHNHAGGVVLEPGYVEAVAERARQAGVPVHVDGARLFNAAVALDRPVAELVEPVDSAMVALTKGLGAPVGSVLAGPEGFVERAARARAMLGGGLRQAGHLAAAARLAMEEGPTRLEEDHANARRLAEAADGIEGLSVDLDRVDTNIVFVDVTGLGVDAPTFAEHLAEHGVGVDGMMRETHARAVTHHDVDADDVDRALDAMRAVAAELR
jgi:threonine aldolase